MRGAGALWTVFIDKYIWFEKGYVGGVSWLALVWGLVAWVAELVCWCGLLWSILGLRIRKDALVH